MEQPQTGQVVTLPPMGRELSAEQIEKKSLTHWIITLYKDISNMMPWGINSQIGYRNQRWTHFDRCRPYPLGNLTDSVVDRAAIAEIHQSGFSLSSTAAPRIQYVKYAEDQSVELWETYGEEGLRILHPLTGMDDTNLVGQIIQTVQPYAYAIHEMEYEFTAGATERIAQSKLGAEDRKRATEVAYILLHGARKAEAAATRQYDELIKSMSDAQVGKPGISNPNEFHQWICHHLNKPVPERVNRMQGGNSNEAINILARRALKEESAAEAMQLQLEQERAERQAEREAFELRLKALEEPRVKKAS